MKVTTQKTLRLNSALYKDYNPQYTDPEYGKDPYWDDELYDKQNI